MDIKEILDYVFQYGIGSLCVCYLIYDRITNGKELNNVLSKMTEALNSLNTRLSIIEDKLERKEL